MLADFVRTGTYQKAIMNNSIDFSGKTVLDVGTGTGILAFFALQAGAAMVYAVDASNSTHIAQRLADANGYSSRIKIIHGKIEDINLPESVDVIIVELLIANRPGYSPIGSGNTVYPTKLILKGLKV